MNNIYKKGIIISWKDDRGYGEAIDAVSGKCHLITAATHLTRKKLNNSLSGKYIIFAPQLYGQPVIWLLEEEINNIQSEIHSLRLAITSLAKQVELIMTKANNVEKK